MSKCEIAIVGASCRFPGGVYDLHSFWDLLAGGINAVKSGEAAKAFAAERFFHPNRNMAGRSVTFSAGWMEGTTLFDAEFFGISPKEAESMDPHQRMLLELSWEAFEDAGIRPSTAKGKNVGVFMAAGNIDSSLRSADDPEFMSSFSMLGTGSALLSNRVSHHFDFKGPSFTVDTACSSALVALHEACRTMHDQNLPMALVGGVHIIRSPHMFIGFSKAGMLSEDGLCRAFDAAGKGFVRGEGGGVVLLKNLDDALRDGDRVHAVIRASAINTNGLNSSLAMPDEEAQTDLLRGIYGEGGIDPLRLAYLEAHGPGTAAGDPIEARAIARAIPPERRGRLWIGSVKTNIGHLEVASGMAGLLKALLVLKHRQIPQSLHFNTPNPDIDFEGLALAVPTRLEPLPQTEGPALAGVNSFGFGGSNAHIVLEEPAPAAAAPATPGDEGGAIPLSAKSRESLGKLAAAYAGFLGGHAELTVRDVAASAVAFREALSHRMVISGATRGELTANLESGAADAQPGKWDRIEGEAPEGEPRTAFVFSGNGSVWPEMGRDLLRSSKIFAASVRELDDILSSRLGWSLTDALANPLSGEELENIEKSQPLLLAMQVGLTRLLESDGVVPDMVYGHSFGEIAAAWAAGAISLREAAEITYYRSSLQGESKGMGAMAAVGISPETAAEWIADIDPALEISAVNAPKNVTMVGDPEALQKVRARAKKKRRLFAMLNNVPYPFHSRLMHGLRDRFIDSPLRLAPGETRIPFISTVTGTELGGAGLNKEYWWVNIAKPVDFLAATERAMENGARLFMEIGPNRTLDLYIKETSRLRSVAMKVFHSMTKADKVSRQVDAAWKTAWVNGWPVRWEKHFSGKPRRVELPLYQWNNEAFDREPTPEAGGTVTDAEDHPLLGVRGKGRATMWRNRFDPALKPWIADHRIGGRIIYPGTAFVEMALATAKRRLGTPVFALENLFIRQAMEFSGEGMRVLEMLVDEEDGFFSVSSRPHLGGEQWQLHAQGRMYGEPLPPGAESYAELAGDPSAFGEAVDVDRAYLMNAEAGLRYGESFRTVREGWIKGDAALARLRTDYSGTLEKSGQYVMPPQLLDGAFHLTTPVRLAKGFGGVYLPYQIEKTRFVAGSQPPEFALSTVRRISDYSMTVDLVLFDAAGRVAMRMDGCRFAATNAFSEPASGHPAVRLEPMFVSRENRKSPAGEGGWERDLETRLKRLVRADEGFRKRNDAFRRALLAAAGDALSRVIPPSGTGIAELSARLGFAPWEVSYFVFLLEELEETGRAEIADGVWRLKNRPAPPSYEDVFGEFIRNHPGAVEDARLLVRTNAFLRARLSGAGPAARPEAPGGSRPPFPSDPAIAGVNAAVAETVGEIASAMGPGVKPRIMLSGAAAADLGRLLASKMAGRPFELLITHADKDEIEEIRAKIGPSADCAYETMSLEGNASIPGGVDIAILSHLLHGMKRPELGLGNLGNILAPGGVLLVAEREPGTIYDIVDGARDDWWEFSQDPAKPVSRLREAEEWSDLLAGAGFAPIAGPIALAGGDARGACLIVAKNHRQPRPPARRPAGGSPWLLVADGKPAPAAGGMWQAVKAEWDEAGRIVESIAADPDAAGGDERINPRSKDCWRRLFDRFKSGRKLNLLFGIGFDSDPDAAGTAELLESRVTAAAMMAKGWAAAGKPPIRVWLLSGGGAPFFMEGVRPAPSQGTLWGFGRTLMNEMGSMDVRLVDIQSGTPGRKEAGILGSLVDEIESGSDEREMIVVGDAVFVPRIHPEEEDDVDSGVGRGGGLVLALPVDRKIRNLRWTAEKPRARANDGVTVEVRAVGLNYRDTMWASGLLPEQALEGGFSGPTLGLEGAGVVTRAGPRAHGVAVGDRVMFFAPQSFSSHAETAGHAVVKMPPDMTFAGAATMPVAFSTAWYAISHLARMRKGESILIHGAAGGVGLAAVQIARDLGLEIFATAGSEEKRAFLGALGVEKVMDSRSLAFGDQIREWTGGRGVDAVLNSIAGRAAAVGLECLAPFGRFLELGKRDFYADSAMRLYPFRNNISYFGIDLDQLIARDRELTASLISQVSGMIFQGRLRPLPHTAYQADQVADAFADMRRSQHIGKIVVDMERPPAAPRRRAAAPAGPGIRRDATYLIVGGTSGFGLATARHLVERGARNLILVGRRGRNAETESPCREWETAGVDVECVAADAADYAALSAKLDAALSGRPPLRGVVHAAAVLDDGVIDNLTPERIAPVIRAKAAGAWNLHRYSLRSKLDFFVLYSSITTVIGNPGQASYVAANTALESLAARRKTLGLPGTAVRWGAIAGTGMLERAPEVLAALSRGAGVQSVTAAEALADLGKIIDGGEAVASSVKMRWNRVRSIPIAATPLYSRLNLGTEEGGGGKPLRQIVSGLPLEKALKEIRKRLVEQLASIMQLAAARIPLDKPLMSMGIDSLMIVELSMLIEDALEKPVPPGFLNPASTVRDLSEKLYIDLCASKEIKAGRGDDLSSLKTLIRRHGAGSPDSGAESPEKGMAEAN